MEKLKAKHDHKLTDILKVIIFGLMLILPGLILLPSMLYYGVNEYATAPTEQVEKIEYKRVNFNQILNESLFIGTQTSNGLTFTLDDNKYLISGTSTNQGYKTLTTEYINMTIGHKYLMRGNDNNIYYQLKSSNDSTTWAYVDTIFTYNYDQARINYYWSTSSFTYVNYISYPQLFDLTKIFGSGNEPTIEEFNEYYPNEYYEYTESKYEILEIPTGTYETYTDITSQIQYNWTSLWQQPLFSWTNYTIVKQGIDNFTGVFGITNTSNISNLIAYELIIVAIYIVIDIVLTLFKWLTHLIGEK